MNALIWTIKKDEETGIEKATAVSFNRELYASAFLNPFGPEYVITFVKKNGLSFQYRNSLEEMIEFVEQEYKKDVVEN